MDVRDFPWEPKIGDPFDVRLNETPVDTWANTILWKLAVVTGNATRGTGGCEIDPDEILNQALELIELAREEGY